MDRFSAFICKHKKSVLVISLGLLLLSFVGMYLTKVNYDILVYLPQDIETIKGQNILTDEFQMGSYSIAVVENKSSKEILALEDEIKQVTGVEQVASLYDVLGTNIPLEILPSEVVSKVHQDNTDLLFITFAGSTSSEETLNAVEEIRSLSNHAVQQGGMSSLVLDTMNLSEQEIIIYIVIAVILCIFVLELALDSYVVPFLLLLNIGCAILFNLGSNIFLGQISYITKALTAVLQLGVTTDFSIFLYHAYEKKKHEISDREKAMQSAIKETFVSVTGSSLTTIAGFLVLCTMQLTLGADLGIVMSKGVLLGVIAVLTIFPSLLLVFDKLIDKTKHKSLLPNFNRLNKWVIKHKIAIFILFLLLFIPVYRANSNVEVYYKLDKSLPETLESIETNKVLKDSYGIVSPEIILLDSSLKTDEVNEIVQRIENLDGIEWTLSLAKLNELGLTEDLLPSSFLSLIRNENYQMLLVNSGYETATTELNTQIKEINDLVKTMDPKAIVAGEGPLMNDLVSICAIDLDNVNTASIICIFIILFFVLKSFSLPFLLIVTIEFAIFLNMGISYLGGTILPFIAPIVLGTIQLGATIDYAILMTTTYLEKRNRKIAKEQAMLETLNYCGHSILTSGMCFFAATFGVGVYSKIEMIGSLCSLLARGAVISMLTVIMVLPSILLLFDKLILKTTLKKGNDQTMKKNLVKNVKKLALWFLILGLSFQPLSVFALTKKETVYTKLNSDGTIQSTLVNEQLVNTEKLDTLEDYSILESIINTNNDNTFTQDGTKLTWNALGKDVFYQGKTNKELPIQVTMSYQLNGEEKTLDEMLGQSGRVTITLKYHNQDAHFVKVNGKIETLYTPFLVTLGTILDGETNTNVTVTNGKVISNGTKNIVVAMATPGLYESLSLDELKDLDTVSLSYDTTKFSLASIYSVVIPKLIDSEDLEVFDKMSTLYNQVNSLQTNMNTIEEGANQLKEGSSQLTNALASSIKELENNKGDALTEDQISGIAEETKTTVASTFTDEYKNALAEATWEQVQSQLATDDATVKNYVTNAVMATLKTYLGGSNDTFNLYAACSMGSQSACSAFAGTGYDMEVVNALKENVASQMTNVALQTSNYVAEKVSKTVAPTVSEQTALTTASTVATTLAPKVANQVKDVALGQIQSSLGTLYQGVQELDQGIQTLAAGIHSFNEQGIQKITNMVYGKLKPITDKMTELMNLSNAYISFATDGTLDNSDTKFIFVIEGKKVPEVKITAPETTTTLSFWDRLKKIFI